MQAAKQPNDPVKMRAALDEADQAFGGIDQHMNTCMDMVGDMHPDMEGQSDQDNVNPEPKQ